MIQFFKTFFTRGINSVEKIGSHMLAKDKQEKYVSTCTIYTYQSTNG